MMRLLVIAAFCFAGCLPANDTHPDDLDDEPKEGKFVGSIGFFSDNAITEIRYARVAMHDMPKPEKVLTLGELSQGRAELLAKADVASWKREYVDDRVCDGMRWVVEFVSGDKVVKRVDGFNAEPPGLKYLLDACGLRRKPCADRDF